MPGKLPEQTLAWGRSRSCIRELSEYAARRKAEIGAENVFDFSLGNPSVPAPDCVNEATAELLKLDSVSLHGYTTAAGLLSLREAIAENLNERFDAHLSADRLYVTCGAAASLAISLRAVLLPGDEVVVLAPFFPEYRVFAEASPPAWCSRARALSVWPPFCAAAGRKPAQPLSLSATSPTASWCTAAWRSPMSLRCMKIR